MLERIGPWHNWNKLISPREMKDIQRDLKGEIVGIGIQMNFDSKTGYIAVTGTIPESAAERAGVLPGDAVVCVNDKLCKGIKTLDVIADIRRKGGERVVLSVLRDRKMISVDVTRAKVAYDTPWARCPRRQRRVRSHSELHRKDGPPRFG